MGQDFYDIYLLRFEVYGSDESVVVSSEIENDQFLHEVRAIKRFSDIRKAMPSSDPCHIDPMSG
jgi:hypothetical protein